LKQVVRKKIAEANNVSTVKNTYTVVIDGTNLLKIALVNKDHNNEEGECYGGVVNFLRMLGDILRKKDFDHCHCCWDAHGSGILRWKLYPDYKANRDKNYGAMNAESDYDKAINAYVKKVLDYSRGKKPEVKRGETEEESFERQKMIVQQILEELCIRQYDIEDVEAIIL
jgi:5'-3' exonuclease